MTEVLAKRIYWRSFASVIKFDHKKITISKEQRK